MMRVLKYISPSGLVLLAAILAGCTITGSPRLRPGYYPTSNWDTPFIDANNLGSHNYDVCLGENNGLVYTCRGGHIDISHLRIAADNVYYLYHEIKGHLSDSDTDFTYKLNADRSVFHVHLAYPDDFSKNPPDYRQAVIDAVSLDLAQYCTWQMITWHEVLTWFGFKPTPPFSDFPSAFSWEDPYSNLLGVRLGAQAIREPNDSFNSAMTRVLASELSNLRVQSAQTACRASEQMRGKWFTGVLIPEMKIRNLDLGYDDGVISPMLVPGICPGCTPYIYLVPKLKYVESLGFKIKLEIEPREWESASILQAARIKNTDRLDPAVHIPIILDYIKQESLKSGIQINR